MSTWFALGAFCAGTGVALGAFGAHGLKNHVGPEMVAVFETGVRYQLIHALALFAVGVATDHWPSKWIATSGSLFVVGMILFSGSLYALALGGPRWLGPVTPLGGICFMVGWLALAIGAIQR